MQSIFNAEIKAASAQPPRTISGTYRDSKLALASMDTIRFQYVQQFNLII